MAQCSNCVSGRCHCGAPAHSDTKYSDAQTSILRRPEGELVRRLDYLEERKGYGLTGSEQVEYNTIVAILFHPEDLDGAGSANLVV